MLNIKVVCAGCGEHVDTDATVIDVLDDITIRVWPCDSIECRNCSDCEIEQEIEKLREVKERKLK